MKRITKGTVVYNSKIANDIFKMIIYSPDAAAQANAGQFVNLYPKAESTILPRPLSISDADPDDGIITIIYRVVGKGTAEFSVYEKGTTLRMSTPLGNGYDLTAVNERAILIGGGLGIPPLILLAKNLVARGSRVTAFLGYRDQVFLEAEMKAAGARLLIATEKETDRLDTTKGNAIDLVKKSEMMAGSYFACGPRPMLKALIDHLMIKGKDAQISMEERMGCGYGACVGCVCTVVEDGIKTRKKICTEGPVFWGSKVVWE